MSGMYFHKACFFVLLARCVLGKGTIYMKWKQKTMKNSWSACLLSLERMYGSNEVRLYVASALRCMVNT